jgi:methyl-accepting chemotaxis protein
MPVCIGTKNEDGGRPKFPSWWRTAVFGSIRTTLTVGFAVLIALMGVVSVASVLSLRTATSGAERLSGFLEDTAAMGAVGRSTSDLGQAARTAFDERTSGSASEMRAAFERAGMAFEDARRFIDAADRVAMLDELERDVDTYFALASEVADDLVYWRSTIEGTLHPLNIETRLDVNELTVSARAALEKDESDRVQAAADSYYNGLVALKYFFALAAPADGELAVELFTKARGEFSELSESLADPELRARSSEILAMLDRSIGIVVELMTRQNRATSVIEGDIAKLESRIASKTDALVESVVAAGRNERDGMLASATTARTIVLGMGFASLVLGIGAAQFLSRSIAGRLRRFSDDVGSIASETSTDLTVRLKASGRDEIATFALTLNEVLERMAGVIRQVSGSAVRLSDSASLVSGSANEIAEGFSRQRQQTDQVAAAIEEMSSSVAEVAAQGAGAADAARASGGEATRGGEIVGETVSEIEAIAREVSQSREAILELGVKGEQIGEIIAVINDIADQTNLLALNAAIEAARAGEHGRGFAVVADEVRKLAERTTQATEQVSRSIKEIQVGTTTAVTRIESSASRVSRGVELAGSAGSALDSIVNGSNGLLARVDSIAAAAQQQSTASEEITRNVVDMRVIGEQSAATITRVAESARSLDSEAGTLNELVSRFKA